MFIAIVGKLVVKLCYTMKHSGVKVLMLIFLTYIPMM